MALSFSTLLLNITAIAICCANSFLFRFSVFDHDIEGMHTLYNPESYETCYNYHKNTLGLITSVESCYSYGPIVAIGCIVALYIFAMTMSRSVVASFTACVLLSCNSSFFQNSAPGVVSSGVLLATYHLMVSTVLICLIRRSERGSGSMMWFFMLFIVAVVSTMVEGSLWLNAPTAFIHPWLILCNITFILSSSRRHEILITPSDRNLVRWLSLYVVLCIPTTTSSPERAIVCIVCLTAMITLATTTTATKKRYPSLLLNTCCFVVFTVCMIPDDVYPGIDPTYLYRYPPRVITDPSTLVPPTWASLYFDQHILLMTTPVGVLTHPLDSGVGRMLRIGFVMSLFAASISSSASFALTLMCCVGSGIAFERLRKNVTAKASLSNVGYGKFLIVATVAVLVAVYVIHSHWVVTRAFSDNNRILLKLYKQNPVLSNGTKGTESSAHYLDDIRSAAMWLRYNTPQTAKIVAPWSLGGLIQLLGNRTVFITSDTKTPNAVSHHIAIAKLYTSNEETAYEIATQWIDAQYVVVLFGGVTSYSDDSLSQLPTMARTVDDSQELSQYTARSRNNKAYTNSVTYKMSYKDFDTYGSALTGRVGYDVLRGAYVSSTIPVSLLYFSEVFTSNSWLVRIYKVKDAG
eukprot:PhF_6_TR35010/c0_g1_i1/m.50943/K07151/STT3; dolichyl-diphosphooligosaccharide--protein glycosyltransferase